MMQRCVRMSVRWAFNFRAWSPTREEWILCNQCIQDEEKKRIQKFVFKKDAKSSMIGRLMIRKVVSEFFDIPYNEVVLKRTDKGKPYIHGRQDVGNFSFNVSHQGEYAVLAAEGNCLLGVDVMKLESRTDVASFFHTMERQFTKEEWKLIRSPLTEQEQLKLFFRLWCLKESYVKALGVGIGFEVQRLNFDLRTVNLDSKVITDTTLKVDGKAMSGWIFEEQLLDNHCIAVAINRNSSTQQDSVTRKSTRLDEDFLTSNGQVKVLNFCDLVKDAQPLAEPDLTFWENFQPKPEDPSQMNASIKARKS